MEEFWPSCISHLRGRFDANIFDAFIAPARAERGGDGQLLVLAPSPAAVRWLEKNIREPLTELASRHFGEEVKISFRAGAASAAPVAPNVSPAVRPSVGRADLRGDFTFDNFVAGRANELALLAAREISGGGAGLISPLLFLYGSSGMGKTHLAQAAGNHYLSLHPGRRVRYLTARDFMHEVVSACRLDRHGQFKRRYDGLDLLIVDDIQYIGGDNKERTQEEFFFIFNQLCERNKIVVITSDRAPMQIRDLPQRLTSRFSSGMPAQLTPPELELREAILRQKIRQHRAKLDGDIIYFIAEKVKSNVRELEGALNRVLSSSRLLDKKPSLELCREALADLLNPGRESVDVETIKKQVAQFYRLRPSDLSSTRRQRLIVQPRQMAIHLCREMTNLSYPEIGTHFGREHTTVLHSCRLIEKKLKTDSKIQDEERILKMLIKS
ncbi:MAG: chromosomal replication initiator protein DnaA [Gammaproteobacteria bacterium]